MTPTNQQQTPLKAVSENIAVAANPGIWLVARCLDVAAALQVSAARTVDSLRLRPDALYAPGVGT